MQADCLQPKLPSIPRPTRLVGGDRLRMKTSLLFLLAPIWRAQRSRGTPFCHAGRGIPDPRQHPMARLNLPQCNDELLSVHPRLL